MRRSEKAKKEGLDDYDIITLKIGDMMMTREYLESIAENEMLRLGMQKSCEPEMLIVRVLNRQDNSELFQWQDPKWERPKWGMA